MRSIILYILSVFLFSACTPALKEEAKRPAEALVPVRLFLPDFQDDSAFSSLEDALKRNLEYFGKLPPIASMNTGATPLRFRMWLKARKPSCLGYPSVLGPKN
jgi:hypothetical protein